MTVSFKMLTCHAHAIIKCYCSLSSVLPFSHNSSDGVGWTDGRPLEDATPCRDATVSIVPLCVPSPMPTIVYECRC